MKEEHSHFGIWLCIIILCLIILLIHNPFVISTKTDDQNFEEINKQNVIFIFDDEKILFVNEIGDRVKKYWKTELEEGITKSYKLNINSTKEIICIEHLFNDVGFRNEVEIQVLDEYPNQYYRYRVNCFEFKPNE